MTDLIILLRHSEVAGALRRGMVVLKMRGSRHDKDIREFTVDSRGMHVGAAISEPLGFIAAQNTADGDPGHAPDDT